MNLYRYDINTKSRLQSTDVCDASTDTVVGIGNRYRYDIVDTDTEYRHLKVTCKCPKRYNCWHFHIEMISSLSISHRVLDKTFQVWYGLSFKCSIENLFLYTIFWFNSFFCNLSANINTFLLFYSYAIYVLSYPFYVHIYVKRLRVIFLL